jgi:hypothetical protein
MEKNKWVAWGEKYGYCPRELSIFQQPGELMYCTFGIDTDV